MDHHHLHFMGLKQHARHTNVPEKQVFNQQSLTSLPPTSIIALSAESESESDSITIFLFFFLDLLVDGSTSSSSSPVAVFLFLAAIPAFLFSAGNDALFPSQRTAFRDSRVKN